LINHIFRKTKIATGKGKDSAKSIKLKAFLFIHNLTGKQQPAQKIPRCPAGILVLAEGGELSVFPDRLFPATKY
jgi:hypothetical protein